MTVDPLTVSLMLLAAVLHAAWHSLVKSSDDPIVSLAGMGLVASIPALALLPFVGVPASGAWWVLIVHDYLELWNWDGTLERIHHALYVAVREQAGREASPTVAIIDTQTAKGTQKGGLGSILRATTRARRSRVESGTSWSTRWVCC